MKKVMIITYYWPPSGKASLHWPFDLAKYFPENGWQPIILTVEEEKFSHADHSLLQDIDPSVKTIRTKTWEPFSLYKKFTGRKKDHQLIASETISRTNKKLSHRISIWIRMNLFIPDARAGWYYFAVAGAKKFLRKEKVDAVISIGPPHTAHLIGRKLSRKFLIPHYPVFIDPWTDIIYYKSFKRHPLTLRLDSYFERSVLENAAHVVFVTNSMKDDYVDKYHFLRDKSTVLYWGYNEENFAGINPPEEKKETEIIMHAGNIFDYQDVPAFWQKIKNEIKAGRKLRLKFAGTVSPAIRKAVSSAGLDEFTDYAGFLPYRQMLSEMSGADFLFVCATEKRHLPGKLFEYMRAGKPVIAFGHDNAEVEELLKITNAGKLFSYSGDGGEVLDNPGKFAAKVSEAKKFDRRFITRRFAAIMDKHSASSL